MAGSNSDEILHSHSPNYQDTGQIQTMRDSFAALGECMADQICQRVAELPDRDSPADWPKAMLVTSDELRNIVLDAVNDASQAEVQPACDWKQIVSNTIGFGFEDGELQTVNAEDLRRIAAAFKAVAAQAPAGEPVAYRVMRLRHDGEWTSDGRYWYDGRPSSELASDIAKQPESWRIDYAYAAFAAAPALPATEDSSAGDLAHDTLRCAVGNCTFNGEVAHHAAGCQQSTQPAQAEVQAEPVLSEAQKEKLRSRLCIIFKQLNCIEHKYGTGGARYETAQEQLEAIVKEHGLKELPSFEMSLPLGWVKDGKIIEQRDEKSPYFYDTAPQAQPTFQQRVQPWMMACFGAEISADRKERNHRFLEEAVELVQSCGCTQSEAHQLVDYVFGRPVGEPAQEVGGVMVTLAALCLANDLDMHQAGETELARIWTKVEAIRAKQAAKPKHSPLPQAQPADAPQGFIKPDTDTHIYFYEQDFYVLSNFSAFNLKWGGHVFPTSEHAYHWEKFEGSDAPYSIRYGIRHAASAHEAFKLAEKHKEHRRSNWDDVKVGTMRGILRAKVEQHEYVRRKLLATGDRILVEDSWRDDFWGWGPNRDGKNMLGKLWMEVRAEIRADANAIDATDSGA